MFSYEMQVKKDVLRSGLGKALVTTLEDISRGFGMPRILLTALNGLYTYRTFILLTGS